MPRSLSSCFVLICLTALTAIAQTPPTTRPLRGAPTPEQLAEAHAIDDAQQQELLEALGRKEPATALPTWVKKAAITQDGRIVVYPSDPPKLRGVAAVRDSAERFAAGKSSIIRGDARLVLADSRGRLFLNPNNGGPLHCLKGNEWTEISLKPADPPADNSRGRQQIRANFAGRTRVTAAREFPDGVCKFLIHAMRDSYLMVTVTPDGQSTCERIGDADNDTDLNAYQSDTVKFVEQANGMITLVPGTIPIKKVFQFDGKAWQIVTVPKFIDADTYKMAAVSDGSFLVFDAHRRMSQVWSPAAAKLAAGKVDAYIDALDDTAFKNRRAAYVHLSLCGEMARAKLEETAKKTNISPETTQTVDRLLQDLGKLRQRKFVDPGDMYNDNSTQTLYAGRYWYNQALLYSADWQGRPLILLTDFVDGMKDKLLIDLVEPAKPLPSTDIVLAQLEPDGDLKIVQTFTDKQLVAAGMFTPPDNIFMDKQMRLWSDGRIVFNADLTPAKTPKGMKFNYMSGPDRDGRFLARSGEQPWVIRVDAVPDKPLLAEQEFTGLDWVRVTPDGRAALAHAGLQVGHKEAGGLDLYRLDQTQTKLPLPFPGSALQMVTPLKDGRVFVYLAAVTSPTSAAYYDGKKWQSDTNPAALHIKLAKELAQVAPSRLTREGEFAGDGKGNGWTYMVTTEPQPDAREHGVQYYPCERLRYFDGKDLHDVWADWNRLDGKPVEKPKTDPLHSAPGEGYPANRMPVCSTRRGAAMLVQNKRYETWQLQYEGAKLKVTPIRLPGEVLGAETGPIDPKTPRTSELQGLALSNVETSTGETWFSLSRSRKITVLKDGQLTVTPHQGSVLMADSRDRIWAIDSKQNDDRGASLFVLTDGRRIDVPVKGATRIANIVDGPDRRLWVVDIGSLFELRAEGDGAALKYSVVNQWKWPTPRTSFSPRFVDNSGGLWCTAGENVVVRITLPPGDAKAK